VKALLKRVEVKKEEVKDKRDLKELEDYIANIRGILTRNNIPYKEEGNVIELEQPTEIFIPGAPALLKDYVQYVTILKFEDEAEKEVLHKNIHSVAADGTVRVIFAFHDIYLQKGWKEKNEVEAIVKTNAYVMKEVIHDMDKELEGLEKTYTLKVTNRMLKELRTISADEVRDVLMKVFIIKSHVVVDKYEYNNLKGEKSRLEVKNKELKESLEKLEEKYDALIDFIKSKDLQEEFVKFLIEKEKEEKEEGIKEEYSELFEEEEEE